MGWEGFVEVEGVKERLAWGNGGEWEGGGLGKMEGRGFFGGNGGVEGL